MNLIQESFQRLFPDQEFLYQTSLQYNRRLSDFNANIRLHHNTIELHFNLQWKDIDDEIKIGLIQHLLLKLLKEKKNSQNIELYHHFIKNIPILTPKTKSDPILESSFQRVNRQFFDNEIEQPNLQWGQSAFHKLASYNFHNDSITVSSLFRTVRPEILDFLTYHELLHKYFKFKAKNGRSSFHSPEFKKREQEYPHYEAIEKELSQLTRKSRRRKFFSFLPF